MNVDPFSKAAIAVIAVSLFAIAVERHAPAQAAAAPAPVAADLPYGEFEFVPQTPNGFIAINRRTGEFAWYQLTAPSNRWKWEKLEAAGRLEAVRRSPTTAP